jgi:hypothetical protein
MTLKRFATTATLAFAGLVLIASPVRAQYASGSGDFLLGFRQVGNNNSVFVDIGPIASLNTGPQTFTLTGLGSVLSSTFGNGWASDANVFFSLSATNRPGDPTTTSWVTSAEAVGSGVESKIWKDLTNTNAGILVNKINAMGQQGNTFDAAFGTAGHRTVVENNTTPNEYRLYMPGGTNDSGHAQGNIAFGFFNPTTEGNFGSGAAGVTLDLYQITNGGATTNALDLGDFSISSDGGTLTYIPDAFESVPEPSTYTMAVLGTLGLLLFQRRRLARSARS